MLNQKTVYKMLIRSGVLLLALVLIGLASSQAQARRSADLIAQGQQIFRFDTFGDEDFWGGQLRLHEAIEGEQFGGVGPGVSPATALEVGLKVDVRALPQRLRNQLRKGQVDLNDPAVTLALLKLNAVVGVTGFFNDDGSLSAVGIQCALCHSTVDDSFAPGIGRRLDGWANRDLNVGAIIALSPDLSPFETLLGVDRDTVVAVLNSWGPGKFDAQRHSQAHRLLPYDRFPGRPQKQIPDQQCAGDGPGRGNRPCRRIEADGVDEDGQCRELRELFQNGRERTLPDQDADSNTRSGKHNQSAVRAPALLISSVRGIPSTVYDIACPAEHLLQPRRQQLLCGGKTYPLKLVVLRAPEFGIDRQIHLARR